MTYIVKLLDGEGTQHVITGDRVENEQIPGFVCIRGPLPDGLLIAMFAQDLLGSILVNP